MMRSGQSVEPRREYDLVGLDDVAGAPVDLVESDRRTTPRIMTQAVIFVGALLVYALLPSRNFNYADDSLSWAYRLTQSDGLINSHHLYLNAMRWLYHLLHGVGLTINPVSLLSLYSALWGAIGLAVLFRLLVRAGMGNQALWGTLFCAFSAGYWSYSIVGDVYVPAIGLMMMGFYCVYSGLVAESSSHARRCAIAAVLAFLAMLAHHQAFDMLVVGLVPAVLLFRKTSPRWRKVTFGVAVPTAVCLLAVALYAVAYLAMPAAQQQGFVRFGAGYIESFEPRADQKQLDLKSLANMAAGETRALVSTNVMFRSPEVAQSIQDRFPYRATYPFPYLVRNIPFPVAVLLGISACLAALLTACLVVRGLWAGLRERGLVLLVFVPMIPQAVFFAWWEGISDEFALWSLPLLAVIVARGAAEMVHPLRWLKAVVATLLLSTLAGSISLYWNPQNDIDFVNDQYAQSLGKGDVLIGFEDIQSDFRMNLESDKQGFEYLNYFNVRDSHQAAQFETSLASAVRSQARIHVSPRLTYPPKSAVDFRQSTDPDFDSQRAALLATLRRIPGIDWLKPKVISEQYFQLDPGMPAPK
ncbi:hypothetical protein EV589_1083 [Mycobacterium sp. BK558]|nr:hypothetical protein EV589_1083 [Mycobacterium sp. BK558]